MEELHLLEGSGVWKELTSGQRDRRNLVGTGTVEFENGEF